MPRTELEYTDAARDAIDRGDESISRWLRPFCVECGAVPHAAGTEQDHVLYRGYVLVGCEGYHQINPNALGLAAPRWEDWEA